MRTLTEIVAGLAFMPGRLTPAGTGQPMPFLIPYLDTPLAGETGGSIKIKNPSADSYLITTAIHDDSNMASDAALVAIEVDGRPYTRGRVDSNSIFDTSRALQSAGNPAEDLATDRELPGIVPIPPSGELEMNLILPDGGTLTAGGFGYISGYQLPVDPNRPTRVLQRLLEELHKLGSGLMYAATLELSLNGSVRNTAAPLTSDRHWMASELLWNARTPQTLTELSFRHNGKELFPLGWSGHRSDLLPVYNRQGSSFIREVKKGDRFELEGNSASAAELRATLLGVEV